jgi:ABC-type uncharacterized transport system substrate-binding protein
MSLVRIASLLIAASLWLLAGVSGAWAHPHVWADMRSQLVVAEDGTITGVRVEWTLDKAYAKDALDGFPTQPDRNYAPEELVRLTEENLKALSDYNYFVVFRYNGEVQKNGVAKDGIQTYNVKDGRLTLTFTVPLLTPLDPKAGEVKLKVYDPEFFIDFEYVRERPLLISRTLAEGCKAKLLPPPSDASIEQTRQVLSTKGRDWKPENNEDFGGMFAQAAIVECGK